MSDNFAKIAASCVVATVLLLILKLVGLIDWNLLWVLAPLWIPLAIGAIILFWMLVYLVFTDGKGFDE